MKYRRNSYGTVYATRTKFRYVPENDEPSWWEIEQELASHDTDFDDENDWDDYDDCDYDLEYENELENEREFTEYEKYFHCDAYDYTWHDSF